MIELILSVESLIEAKNLERKYIEWCRFIGFNLCNMTDGGDFNPMFTEDGLEKYRQAIKNKKRSILSENARKKISERMKKENPMKNLETRIKVSKSVKNIWNNSKSNSLRLKISKLNSRKVFKFDLQNNFLKEYSSVRAAALENNINYSGIYNNALGYTKTSHGFIWRYENE